MEPAAGEEANVVNRSLSPEQSLSIYPLLSFFMTLAAVLLVKTVTHVRLAFHSPAGGTVPTFCHRFIPVIRYLSCREVLCLLTWNTSETRANVTPRRIMLAGKTQIRGHLIIMSRTEQWLPPKTDSVGHLYVCSRLHLDQTVPTCKYVWLLSVCGRKGQSLWKAPCDWIITVVAKEAFAVYCVIRRDSDMCLSLIFLCVRHV